MMICFPISLSTLAVCLFHYSHPDGSEEVLICISLMVLSTFSCAYEPFIYLNLEKNVYSNLLPTSNWVVCLFSVDL